MSAGFQAPPSDLKALSPFLQRAHETKTADAALSYWCNYHAAQIGIPLAGQLQPSSKNFLFELLDTLEAQKKALASNEIVNGDEIVAKAYVESVALKVFAGADSEDRSGKASKATARRFLAAANFFEVLSNFGPLEPSIEEKIKYSKWKVVDIGKALREGRQPTPGGPGDAPEEVDDTHIDDEAMNGTQKAADRLAGLSASHPQSEDEYIEREMAKLREAEIRGSKGYNDPPRAVTAISPPDEDQSASIPSPVRRQQSRLSYDGRAAQIGPPDEAAYKHGTNSPNFSRPLSSASPSPILGENGGVFAPVHNINGATSPSSRPLPMPPSSSTSSGFLRREGLPQPPGGGSTDPLIPPPHLLSPSVSSSNISQTPPIFMPSRPSQPSIPITTQPSAPSVTTPSYQPSAPSPSAPSALPSSLDHTSSARVQKLAKWAVSALDYEDVETARKHLRDALDICEGKSVTGK